MKKLSWRSSWLDNFPPKSSVDQHHGSANGFCSSIVRPEPVADPKLIGWSSPLAQQLGLDKPDTFAIQVLGGNKLFPGMQSYATRYGGHQFGQWAGQLGDGRAIYLGEAYTLAGLQEFQLKGAGVTPYSRRADGRAVLRSSLREFVCSEAMHFLGIPTTRALSLVLTGDVVRRDLFYDGNPQDEPGAIVCRVSPSFLRFGHFEILARDGNVKTLQQLARFSFRYFPELNPKDIDIYGQLLDSVAARTAHLMTEWMRVGFVHGVMNTDNMSLLGLTIDYGPYGWLEPYEPDWTPNTTDAHSRRYAFGNQPSIGYWNVARLCESFYPLIPDKDRLQGVLEVYKKTLEQKYFEMLSQKLGVRSLQTVEDQEMLDVLFQLLQLSQNDYTIFFRKLSELHLNSNADHFFQLLQFSCYQELKLDLKNKWSQWFHLYQRKLLQEAIPHAEKKLRMNSANPKYIFRNYLAHQAIVAAEKHEFSVLERLMRVFQTPYGELPDDEDLCTRRPEWASNTPGCSALSCSS